MTGPVFSPTTLELFAVEQPEHRMDTMLVDTGGVDVDERRYRIFRAIPRGPAPADGWPALWLTDGNAWFDRLPGSLLATHPDLAIIGVGYETDLPFDVTHRALDYTPGPLRPDPRKPDRNVGGAEAFLERLLGPIRERAERDVPLDPARRTLAGHSYGGLFALWVRQLRTGTGFTRFGAASPALWLDDPGLDQPGPPTSASAHLWVGDDEGRKHHLPPHAQRFTDRAAERGEDVALTVLPQTPHGATLAACLPELLAFSARRGGTAAG